MKKENGITLVALVISIIVLLILATVSIQVLTGDNGLLTKSKFAVDKYSEGEIEEQIKLAYTEWQTAKLTGTTENDNDFIKNSLSSSIGNVEDVSVDDSALTVTISKNDENKTYYYNAKKGTIKQIELAKNSTNKNDSYVGCYADIDEDGIVDGVIFADLLTGSIKENHEWGWGGNGVYTLSENVTVDNVKKYYISQKNYTDRYFGTHAVISDIKTNKEQRFYVMQLNDFTTTAYTDPKDNTKSYPAYISYYWYKNASGKMNPLITSTDFGTGRENTRKMIEKWNAAGTSNGYSDSPQDNQDIWKHMQKEYNKGWFIPSRGEWAAFSNEIGITSNEIRNAYGLGTAYWTSSQKEAIRIWAPYYYNQYYNMQDYNVSRYTFAIRLATTF